MSSPLLPYITKAILSTKVMALKRARAEKSRKRQQQPHRVTVYLRINDAHSYLLLQVLEHLQQHYALQYDFRTVLNLQPDMYPAPVLWEKNAFDDGQHLAALYREIFPELKFPDRPPESSPDRDTQLTAQLLHWELQPDYLANALALFRAYWHEEESALDSLVHCAVTEHAECYQHHLQANESMLKKNGHYLSAMLHYAGEWYWGLNRLQYLERRMQETVSGSAQSVEVTFDLAHRKFCNYLSPVQVEQARAAVSQDGATETPVELFFSIRSPYSYLGLVRLRQLTEYYGVPLLVKPVLPMVMRRMQVPKTKGFYILRDVKREALQYGIDFGFVADPLGTGVENCYAVFDYAQSEGKGIEYLESYARGVWAEGIRSDTSKGLQQLVTRVGLNWQHAEPLLEDESWRNWAQHNLAELYANNQWGVPSIKYGSLTVFGQDRIDRIEHAIAKQMEPKISYETI